MATAAQQQQFISQLVDAIRQQSDNYGLFPSVIMGQAIVESGWGQSGLSKNYNNFFGMKASNSQFSPFWIPNVSPVSQMLTREVVNGNDITVNANWRVYNSLAESIADHNALIGKAKRYAAALTARTPREQLQAIKNGGYATAPNYVDTIMNVIDRYNLTQYDNIKPEGTITVGGKKKAYRVLFALGIVFVAVAVALAVFLIIKRKKLK